jgi:archaellum biogenesis ATPase FlaH
MYEKEIGENSVLLCIISEESYQKRKADIIKALTSNSKNICYVSFTKPYQTLRNELKSAGFEGVSFFFIDTLTMSVQSPPKADDCIFVQAPNSLVDISVAISKVISREAKANILIDSLSSLLVYQDSHTLIKFLHNIINKMRIQNVKIVFLVFRKDISSELIKDLYMFVDKVLE